MSNTHQDSGNTQPPITTAEPHHQPPSSTTENLPGFTTLRIPKTPSPTTTSPTQSSVETTTTSTTPESLLAAAIGHVIFNITTTNPLVRTLSDASINQDSSITTTTPPSSKNTIPTKNQPLLHAVSNMINTYPQPHKTRPNKPVRRALADTAEYQQSKKTRTPPPRISSSTGNPSPCLEIMRKVEDMIREMEQRCLDIMRNQDDNPDPSVNPPLQSQAMEEEEEEEDEKEECVGVERDDNGDIKFELNCSCGKRYEMLIKPNGYCFYRLT